MTERLSLIGRLNSFYRCNVCCASGATQRPAAARDAEAQYQYALCLNEGFGVTKDLVKAAEY
jgi:TPR repeat protein